MAFILHRKMIRIAGTMMTVLLLMMTKVRSTDAQQYSSAESYYACDRYYIGQLGTGVITHDNYPFNYTERLNCRHRFFIQPFHSSIDWKICFTFLRFHLTDSEFCSDDYLEFAADGLKFCGEGHRGGLGGRAATGLTSSLSEPDNIFTSPLCWSLKRLSTFDILFNSRDDSTNLGFYANYTISYNTEPLPTCKNVDDTLSDSLSWSSLILPKTCQWVTTECEEHQFRCFSGSTCISDTQVCDGIPQCSDGSDETYDHARCPGKQDLSACTFEPDGSGIDDGTCGMRLDGWILDTASPSGQWVDHTYRGVQTGRFLYSDYTQKDYVYANYTVPQGMLKENVGTYCLRFYYYMSGNVGDLSLNLKTGSGEWSIAWLRRGSQAVSWLPAEILIEPPMLPITEVSFRVYNTPSTLRSVGLDDISIIEGPCIADDISCTFSDGMCGWRPHLSTLSAMWTRAQRVPPSRYTGPSSDHTNNNGSFLYMNGSEYQSGQKARLISSSVNQGYSGAHCLHFWYYMYGTGVGSLRVYTLGYSGASHEVWEKNGNQDRKWLFGSVTLNRIIEPFQIILEGERGSSAMSDIAVDDIQLNPGYCDQNYDYGGMDPRTTPPPGGPQSGGCGAFELRCATVNACYHRVNRCDGMPDCDDHSDEENCPGGGSIGGGGPTPCSELEVRCLRSLTCIPTSKLCDGYMDCEDGSDEFRCKTGGGLMSRHMDAGAAPSVIIGSIMAAVIALVICVIAFIIVIRRRRAGLARGSMSIITRVEEEDRDNSPNLLPQLISPPKYSDLTPPPYVLIDDKDGGEPMSPPSYEVASLSMPASRPLQQAPQVVGQQQLEIGQGQPLQAAQGQLLQVGQGQVEDQSELQKVGCQMDQTRNMFAQGKAE